MASYIVRVSQYTSLALSPLENSQFPKLSFSLLSVMQLRGAGRAAAETTKDEARAEGRKNTFSCGKKGPLFKETPGLQKWASRDADARSLLHLDHADLDRILRVAVLRSSAFQAREAAAQKEAAARTWCVVGLPPNV